MIKPRLMLNDKQWKRLRTILLEIGLYDKSNLRKTVEGVLYRMRVGLPWRDLPRYFGKPNTIYKAFNRWSSSNKLILLLNKIIDRPDMEWVFIDGSHIKAHQHSSVANPKQQAITKSSGGNTTKIHLAVDAHGNPLTFIITDGTTHDIKVATDLIDKIDLSCVVMLSADKGYDSQSFREYVKQKDIQVNIPHKSNSKQTNEYMDWYLYKLRHLVENAFCKIKTYRAIATRFDKLKQNFENNVALAFTYQWLRL